MVFVGRLVGLEATDPLRDEGGLGEIRDRFAEACARGEGFIARVLTDFRLAPRPEHLHVRDQIIAISD